MAATKTITPTKPGFMLRSAFCVAALLCTVFAVQNLWLALQEQGRADTRLMLSSGGMPTLPHPAADSLSLNFAAAQAVVMANRTDDFAVRMDVLQQARQWQEQALQLSPADPFGWERYAALRLVTQNNREAALVALRLSVVSSPYEPALMTPRAVALYQLRDMIAVDDPILANAWRGAAHANTVMLVQAIKPDARMQDSVEMALQGDAPDAYKKWQRQSKKAGLN